jgi:hypothetical protein
MLRNFKVLLIVLVVIVIAGSAYAFAATNTVPDSAAGYKANVVHGYTVENIVYDLNPDGCGLNFRGKGWLVKSHAVFEKPPGANSRFLWGNGNINLIHILINDLHERQHR